MRKIAEGFEDVEGAELKGCVADHGGVKVGGEVGGGFLAGTGAREPGLFEQPILVTAFAPFAKVSGIEVFGIGPESFDDVGIGDAVEHPSTDSIAEWFGQPSDFAVAAISEGR